LILGGAERDVLGGRGGGGNRATDHSSQDATLIEKGSIGIGLLRGCGTADSRLSGVEWEALEEAEGITTDIV
jgi:hypothetical protein